ncbi:Small G protein signaling modulator 3 [Exaiptasia diaphana]|nr:Small G protein signaling modulator 3 [Exaiptasia diaphana]
MFSNNICSKMDIAKFVFSHKDKHVHEGYSGSGIKAPTLSEDEDDGNEDTLAWDDSAIPVGGGSTPVTGSFVPAIGGPFSALTPSMWPQDILSRIQQTEDSGNRPEGQYDEFGFIIDGDLEHEYKDPDPGNFVTNEDEGLRLKWTAYLEFTQNQDVADMTWDKVSPTFPRSEKLRELVFLGIPHSMRAPFVQILDERSKEYSSAGDDSVSETVTDLVRGGLCPSLKSIFEHGMRRPSILGGPCHPWLFIEEASQREVERDFQSVYSRLVLCKTFRLDEDGKVLSPEEILYRAVQSINMSHDTAGSQMDVKFRSLICYGLNEQCLHLWLESLCACEDTVAKWYHPWSFLRSPGWIQIKCELRILASFSFNLNVDWELTNEPKAIIDPIVDDKHLQQQVRL